MDTAPKIYEENGNLRVTSELKDIFFNSEEDKFAGLSAYLSTLFFWYYATYADCRNLNKREVATFPFSLSEIDNMLKSELKSLGIKLINNFNFFCFISMRIKI